MTQNERLFNREYLSLFVINLTLAISFSMVTATMPLYLQQAGVASAVTGTVIGALSISSMCIRPFSGILSDRVRRRRLLQGALLMIAAAMLGYSLTQDVRVLLCMRVLHGLGFSLATTVTMALVAGTVPQSRLTQGMGYFAIGQTIANAVAPGFGMFLCEKVGYTVSFRFACGLQLAAIALSFLFVKPSEKPTSLAKTGLHLSDFLAREALPYGMLSIVVAGSTGVENGFIALMGKQVGLGMVGWYFTVSAAALFVSRLTFGKLADRKPLLVTCGGVIAIALAFALLGLFERVAGAGAAAPAFVIAAVFKALGLGAVQPALQSASLRSVEQSRRGAASCTYYLGTDIGQSLGPIFGGTIVGLCGYADMFALASLPLLAGAGLYALYAKAMKGRMSNDR